MIFAEIHGKLGAGAERATERSEDVLTSTVLGTLRYLSVSDGIAALLSRVRQVAVSDRGAMLQRGGDWLETNSICTWSVEFWRRLGKHGEVDAVIRLFDEARTNTHVILVEAKYLSPKSRRGGDEDAETDESAPDPDQLVDYWRGGQKLVANTSARLSLVYLTAGGTPPIGELVESLKRCPGMRLAWLSWRDVSTVARAAARASQSLPAEDLARYLAHKGLAYFDGFHAELPDAFPAAAQFFRARTMMRAQVPAGAARWLQPAHFWRDRCRS